MLTRLTHSAIAFAITVVVYQAYVLLAAPLIEPPLVEKKVERLTPEQIAAAQQATHKYRDLLSAYFPPEHWTLTQPPITAENGQAMIVIDAYDPSDDGQVRVEKCALLFFPNGRVRGEPPPRDAVILEARQGAVLQMDNTNNRGVGGFGKLERGRLTGTITVRSDMREPGSHDDLYLTTQDVEIQPGLIFTRNQVEMQLGPHRGSGRHLDIRLIDVQRSRSDSAGLTLGNLDSLEVLYDVQAMLSPGEVNFGSKAAVTSADSESPPVQITSGGKFRFDFSSQVASFNNKVLLRQVHPTGQLDQLNCQQLFVYFANDANSVAADSTLGKLSAGTIEATGTNNSPVMLNAESQQAHATCRRIQIELDAQRITFEHAREVVLSYEGNEIHARQIQYQAPPKESNQQVGKLHAAGSGWLRAITSNKSDAKPFEVRWTEEMRLQRVNDRPVLMLKGRPRLDMVGLGQLWSDYLNLYLRESGAQGADAELLPGDVVPERLVAGGQIAIDSAQLQGKVKQLEVQFDYVPAGLSFNNTENLAADKNSLSFSDPKGKPKRTYDIAGDTLKMLVTVRENDPEITRIDVDGQVVFNESKQATSTKEPLNVQAERLRVENADSPAAQISLYGKPATISADGMLIRTEQLQINRGTSRARVAAPGEIEMLVDRDLSGKRLVTPQPMTIRWQRSMELNQDRITFIGNVQVQTAEGSLNTQQMVVKLSDPVQFDGASRQRRIEIAQLECSGGIHAQFSQRDALGLASVQTIKLEDSFFANLQTGELRGTGPGWMESVHLSKGTNPWGDLGNQPRQLAQPRSAQRLRFLGLQFVRGVRGNLQSRRIEVLGDVEAVYGPVDAWEQRLALTKRGMPGPDTIWINSQSLEVRESPLARLNQNQQSSLGPLELEAHGNVTIEGPVGERGNFTTRSQHAKYDQSKKTFILEGTNQEPATIMVQEYRGARPNTTSARKILYFQETGDVKVEGLRGGQLRQVTPQR